MTHAVFASLSLSLLIAYSMGCSESYSVVMKKIWEATDSHARQWRTVFKVRGGMCSLSLCLYVHDRE